jgi:hypothetical protein
MNKYDRRESTPNIQNQPGTLADRVAWALERGESSERLKAPLLEMAYGDSVKGLLELADLLNRSGK